MLRQRRRLFPTLGSSSAPARSALLLASPLVKSQGGASTRLSLRPVWGTPSRGRGSVFRCPAGSLPPPLGPPFAPTGGRLGPLWGGRLASRRDDKGPSRRSGGPPIGKSSARSRHSLGRFNEAAIGRPARGPEGRLSGKAERSRVPLGFLCLFFEAS